MATTLSATFDDAYAADRAVARLRKLGIHVRKFSARTKPAGRSASLYVSEPYGLYGAHTSANALMAALPLTNGNSLMMHTPFFSGQSAGGSTRVCLLLEEAQLPRARAILRNCGGSEVRARD